MLSNIACANIHCFHCLSHVLCAPAIQQRSICEHFQHKFWCLFSFRSVLITNSFTKSNVCIFYACISCAPAACLWIFAIFVVVVVGFFMGFPTISHIILMTKPNHRDAVQKHFSRFNIRKIPNNHFAMEVNAKFAFVLFALWDDSQEFQCVNCECAKSILCLL